MNEKYYCERCDLHIMQLQEQEPDDTCEVWYCPICETCEEHTSTNMETNK